MSFNPQNLDLTNSCNYKDNIEYKTNDVCKKYIDLVNYSIILGNENLSILDNKSSKHKLFKGIEIISNVFLQILMYTRNLEITLHCCNQGIFYYVEYINQIDHKDNDFVFVNLTVQDAMLYIYKKTIYELDDMHVKKFKTTEEDNKTLKIIELFIKYYNNIIRLFIYNKEFSKLDFDNIQKHLYQQNGVFFCLFDDKHFVNNYMNKDDSSIFDKVISDMTDNFETLYSELSEIDNYKDMIKNIDNHINGIVLKYID
jgi:hypothetical protein